MEYFNLNDGQTAVVRILSSTVDNIETGGIHTIETQGKRRKVKCLTKNCPLCESGNEASTRLFVHLWDYTDNKEKVWNRTNNESFVKSLKLVEEDWGNIGSSVIRITREGSDFPKYNVIAINPKSYADMPEDLYDTDAGWMCATYRSAEEMAEFLKTGILPDHVKKTPEREWLPKEEWLAQQQLKEEAAQKTVDNLSSNNVANDEVENGVFSNDAMGESFDDILDDDPFASNPFFKKV